jgi:hypothetical protein
MVSRSNGLILSAFLILGLAFTPANRQLFAFN